MQLGGFYLPYVNDSELYRLGAEVDLTLGEFLAADAGLARVRTHLQTQLVELQRVLDREDTAGLTQQVVDADDARDQLFRSFYRGVEFHAGHFDPAIHAAGSRLAALADRDIPKTAYGEQTLQTSDLLTDLADPAAIADLATTGLTGFVEELRISNDAFDEIYRRRQAAEAEDDLPKLKEIRPLVRFDLSLIHSTLEFLILTEPASVEDAIPLLNERAEAITLPARRRRGRGTEEPPEEPTPETE
jgi:hypothetical protein